MQNSSNLIQPNKGKSYTQNKNYKSPNTQEPEQKPTYLSGLFKPPSDPREAEIERARLYGRVPQNTNINGSFSIK